MIKPANPSNFTPSECAGPMFIGISKMRKNKKRLLLVPEYVRNVLPRYMPNLRDMQLHKQFSKEMDGHVVSMLMPLHIYRHDAQAAQQLEEELCTVFEVPKSMFPPHAPLNKITFMPPQLLPPACEAGGVFAPGVLARKFYPPGLLSPRHVGQTPALFVGRRIVLAPVITRSKFEHLLPYMCTEYTGLPIKKVLKQLGSDREDGEYDNDDDDDDEEQDDRERVVNGEGRLVKLGYIIAHANTMDKVAAFANQPVQYNTYVPDLSTVQIMVYSQCKFVVTVLSDVVHPHEPEVAKSVKEDNEGTVIFPLPIRNFYYKGMDEPMKRAPVYLPQRFLPKEFEAGCVFGPGTLPESLYMRMLRNAPPQMQHNKGILPPLFLGLWKNQCTPADCIFPKKSFLVKVPKAQARDLPKELETVRHAINTLDDPKLANPKNNGEQQGEEDVDSDDVEDEKKNEVDIDTDVFEDGDDDEEEEEEEQEEEPRVPQGRDLPKELETVRHAINTLDDPKLANPKNNGEQQGEEDVDSDDVEDEKKNEVDIDTDVFEDGDEEEEEEEEEEQEEEPRVPQGRDLPKELETVRHAINTLDDPKLANPKNNGEQQGEEDVDSDDVEDEKKNEVDIDTNVFEDGDDEEEEEEEEEQEEEPRVPPLPELPTQICNMRPPESQSQPQRDSPSLVRDPGLWFFELSGHPEEIEQSLHRVKNAGVKLASSYTDQETIKRAREQWMDLIHRRDEIRKKMVAMPPPSVPRNKTQRRHRPWPGTVCSFCGFVFE